MNSNTVIKSDRHTWRTSVNKLWNFKNFAECKKCDIEIGAKSNVKRFVKSLFVGDNDIGVISQYEKNQ